MICPTCRSENRDGALFCISCGSPLPRNEAPQDAQAAQQPVDAQGGSGAENATDTTGNGQAQNPYQPSYGQAGAQPANPYVSPYASYEASLYQVPLKTGQGMSIAALVISLLGCGSNLAGLIMSIIGIVFASRATKFRASGQEQAALATASCAHTVGTIALVLSILALVSIIVMVIVGAAMISQFQNILDELFFDLGNDFPAIMAWLGLIG
nr:zinc ribbon domain-containing protein [bacterium]